MHACHGECILEAETNPGCGEVQEWGGTTVDWRQGALLRASALTAQDPQTSACA